MKIPNNFSKKGFTLMELLVSIAIIGILSAIIIPSLSGSKEKSRDSRRMTELKDLSQAVENYIVDNDYQFPSSLSDLSAYFSPIPSDPLVSSGHPDYSLYSINKTYCLGAKLETPSLANTVSCDSGNPLHNYKIQGP
jgi:prepilin-type N-terminal cleavage/methylation domain-containing protein